MKYKSKEDAQQDHIQNYRSDGVAKMKGSMYASDYLRVQFIIQNVPKRAKVLDVGVNGGTIALPLIELGCKVKGIDIVPELVELAKKRGVFAEIGEAEDLSKFKDETFDAVICAEVLEHLYEPLVAVQEAYRVLKPGGVYLATVPHPASRIASDGMLGDYHQQNFTGASLDKIFHNVFERGSVDVYEIPYNPLYCRANHIQEAAPQWLALKARKT